MDESRNCGGSSTEQLEQASGNLSAPVTVTFDGYGQVSNDPANDPPGSTTLASRSRPS